MDRLFRVDGDSRERSQRAEVFWRRTWKWGNKWGDHDEPLDFGQGSAEAEALVRARQCDETFQQKVREAARDAAQAVGSAAEGEGEETAAAGGADAAGAPPPADHAAAADAFLACTAAELAAAATWSPHLSTDGRGAASIGDPVTFPPFRGTCVNMMPIILGAHGSLPDELLPYAPLLEACPLPASEQGRVGYLTVHESVVVETAEGGCTQRRGGVHAEGGFVWEPPPPPPPPPPPAAAAADSAAAAAAAAATATARHRQEWVDSGRNQPLTIAWGRGVFQSDHASAGDFHGGIYMASNVARSTAVWNTRVLDSAAAVGHLGDLSHMRGALGAPALLRAGELVWMTDTTPHESLPLPVGTRRQYFRLVTHEISAWYAMHSTPNPLGVMPGTGVVIVDCDKFAMPAPEAPGGAGAVGGGGAGAAAAAAGGSDGAAAVTAVAAAAPAAPAAAASGGNGVGTAAGSSSSSSDDDE